jgi:tRNA A-37 threonylcarbamoyl transferase component Bud32/WD40 repeat protein
MNDSESGPDQLNELAHDFAERFRRGERPSLTEYAVKYPALAADIRELFPAMALIEQFGSVAGPIAGTSARTATPDGSAPRQLGEYRILREVARGGMGIVYEAVQESLGRHVALKVLPFQSLANATHRERFRREARAAANLHHSNIVPVFGVGEHDGIHYFAMQFIQGQALDSVLHEVSRLRRARASEVGGMAEATHPPARVVRGEDLSASLAGGLLTGRFSGKAPEEHDRLTDKPVTADQCSRNSKTDPGHGPSGSTSEVLAGKSGFGTRSDAQYFRSVAQVGIQVADALSYAHQQGVLHRDVKPSNLLLDSQGTVWVTDFGLAKSEGTDELTGPGDFVGTLRYTAPERFEGQDDVRSDVFSLGLTLYEMVTLRPAFAASGRAQMIERLLHEQPRPPRKCDAHVPQDLDTLILKAIAKEPGQRYQSAGELADDLRQFLADRPIRARRSRWTERLWRWCRRNPAVATLTTTVALLLVAVAVGSGVAALRLGAALADANGNLNRALTAEVDADVNRWRGHLLDARASHLSRASGQRFAALASLRQAVTIARDRGMPPERFDEMRSEAIAALALPDLYVERWWDGWPKGTQGLSFAGDQDIYARAEGDGTVSVRRVADDREFRRLPALGGPICVLLSPDGRSLLQYQKAAPFRGRLWNLSGASPAALFEESALDAYPCYSADGGKIALTHRDGAISVYDPTTGRRVHNLPPDTVVTHPWIDLHPYAPFVAVSSYYHPELLIRDLRSGAVVARLRPPWRGGGYATWHPAGRSICIGQGDGDEVRVYDFDPTAPGLAYRRSLHSKSGGGTFITFDRAGDRATVVGWGGTFGLFDFGTGRLLFETLGESVVGYPHFDASGGRLATAVRLQEAKVGLWSVGNGHECRTLLQGRPPYALRAPAVSPDGRLLAINILSEGLVLFDLATNHELAAIPFKAGPVGRIGSFRFEPSGALLTASMDGCFRWPVRPDPSTTGRLRLGPPERLPFHEGGAIASSRDGRVIAQAMYDGYGMQPYAGGWILHPEQPGKPRRVMAGASGANAAVSPDGRWVAFGVHLRHVCVFEAATGREVWRSPPGSHHCQFTPDGRWLVTDANGCRCYIAGTWEPGPQLGPGELYCVSADSRLAVLGKTDGYGYFRLVEVETGRELARIEPPERYAGLATFTPDGTRLVANSKDGVSVWDLRLIRQGLSELGLDWDAPPFSPESPRADNPPLEVQIVGTDLPRRHTGQ